MAAKSQPRFFPSLLRHHQYSGAISTILYNWPLFLGAVLFGLATVVAGTFLQSQWEWVLIVGGLGTFILLFNIVVASFVVYDWGHKREYERLAELGDLSEANVVIDISCGKLRGTRGMLSQVNQWNLPWKPSDESTGARESPTVCPSLIIGPMRFTAALVSTSCRTGPTGRRFLKNLPGSSNPGASS
jgi:cytochrome c biogenesis protein CcdA